MREIASNLGVSLASVHQWTADIEISPEHVTRNLERARRRNGIAWSKRNRQRRLAFQEEGREQARQGDLLHQAGCMLYWAEGAKDRNSLMFANSDVNMSQLFLKFLRQYFEITDDRIALRLNVYLGNEMGLNAIEAFWLDRLSLPKTCFGAHTVNHYPTSSSGLRRNKLPYGVCSIRVRRSTRILQHIYGAIQEYAGFDEPRWLDCNRVKSAAKKSDSVN